jgi:hypothetical protein
MRYAKLFLLLLLIFCKPFSGQPPKLTIQKEWDDPGNTTPAQWSSPEILLRDLRSSDESSRMSAFALLGITDEQAHITVWAQTSPSHPLGSKLVVPSQIQLRYAALGDNDTQQAILAVEIGEKQLTFVAVATPKRDSWERVATFSCWCKYDLTPDALSEFVQLQPAPELNDSALKRLELVIHESGGGSGIYDQTEARFRMRQGKLVRVASFISRRLSCPGTDACSLERRWFEARPVQNVAGAILLEARGQFMARNDATFYIRNLEIRGLKRITCTSFQWNDKLFRYEQVPTTPNPCPAR